MPNGIGNRATWLAGQNPALDGGSPHGLLGLPNLLEFGSNVGMGKDDTAAINAAIKSLGKGGGGLNGGAIFVPEAPKVYTHEGEINLEKLTGVRLVGAGGIVGGGGIGVGASIASSVFLYTGSGARGWNFRGSVGCGLENIQCFANNPAFTGNIWDCSGLNAAEVTALAHFINARAEATKAPGAAKIPHCVGLVLDFAIASAFDFCTFSSCLNGVVGLTNGAHESVSNSFLRCFFAANQLLHVANVDDAWEFDSCVAEGLFNDVGVGPTGAGFIGYTNPAFKSRSASVRNCWSGSNVAAKRVGTNIEWRGPGLEVNGGELGTAESGIFFPEEARGSNVTGVRLTKMNNGIVLGVEKCVQCQLAFNTPTEIGGLGFALLGKAVGSLASLIEVEGKLKVFE